MVAAARKIGARFALTLGGEVVQSAFHFVLNIVLVRSLSVEDYGIFAIVMLIGGLSLTYVRALVGMPATLLIAQRHGTRAARAIEATFGSAAFCLAALIAVAVALLLQVWLHADAVPGALFVGLWSFRSYLRAVLLAEHRQSIAGLSDLTLALVGGVLAMLFLRPHDADTLDTALLLLCAANGAAILLAMAARPAPLRMTFRPSMRRRFKALGGQLVWSAAGTTTANVQAQGQVLLVASFAGPSAYAPLAAMLVLFAPLRLLAVALANILQPELAARAARVELPKLRRMLVLWTASAVLIGAVYGVFAVAALPLMGSKIFQDQPKLMIGFLAWAINTTALLSLLPRLLLEVLREFYTATLITAVSAVLGMAAVSILLASGMPAWTLFGNFLGEVLVLVLSWQAVARAQRQSSRSASPPPWLRKRGAVQPLASRATRAPDADERPGGGVTARLVRDPHLDRLKPS